MTHIPSHLRASCTFCGNDLNISKEGAHQLVTGWAKVRDAGGANAIALRKPQNKWACASCVERASRGFIKQPEMFT